MSQRLALCRLAVEERFPVAQLARDFEVSRKTAYKWIRRYQTHGDQGVWDRSRKPNKSPNRVSEEVVAAVLGLKADHPVWGPRKLHRLLRDRLALRPPSRSTVARILARYGLVGRREPNAASLAVGRFERSRVNELWQMDFTAPTVLPDGRTVWVCAVLDDRSRYCLSVRAGLDCSTGSALACFQAAAERGGLPEEVLTDHGSAFGATREYVSAFKAYLWALGVKHTQSRYRHPQTQGKLERFNGTLQAECIDGRCCGSIQEWNLCLEEYRKVYNTVRPHEALGDETPGSIYQPSDRVFAEPDRADGERGEIVRRVGPDGRLTLLQHRVKVGKGLAGWFVSAHHQKDGHWLVEFRGHPICQVHLARRTTYRPKP